MKKFTFLAVMLFASIASASYRDEFVELTELDSSESKLSSAEFHDKYPKVMIKGIKLFWDSKDKWYHYDGAPQQRALFMKYAGSDGKIKAILAEPDERKDGVVVKKFNHNLMMMLDATPKEEPVELTGTVAKSDDGQQSLVVKGVGTYIIKAPEKHDSDIDVDDVSQFNGETVVVKAEYLGNGEIRPLLISIPNSFGLTVVEQQMIDEANRYRKRAGSPPLVPSSSLMRTARQHSTNMAARRSMFHGGTSGWSGENVAVGQSGPVEVTRAWYNSPGHRANMLNRRFTKIGVGGVNRHYTQQFN